MQTCPANSANRQTATKMNNNLSVTKRNGEKEPIDLEKIHKVITWAAKGLNNVSVSQVEIKAHIQFYDGIKTAEIHETLIKLPLAHSQHDSVSAAN